MALVPLAFASWAVVRLVSSNTLDKADANLEAVIGDARVNYATLLSETAVTVSKLAVRPRIQRALAHDDRAVLRAYVHTHPNVTFKVERVTIPGGYTGPAATRFARVKRIHSKVILARPLDDKLLDKLRPSDIGSLDRLVLLYAGEVVAGSPRLHHLASAPSGSPGDIRVEATTYRAVSVRLEPHAPVSVVALRSRAAIDAKANRTWWRVLGAALVTLATVALLAYLVAPGVAGKRWVRRLMPWELEEQYAVEAQTDESYAAPAPSHGAGPSQGSSGASEAAAKGARRRIVVIDDDPEERALFADTLGPDGVEVAATGDAEQGLGLLGATPADLAILDWKMSGRSGAEILAELNIRHPDLPVLIVADELEPQQRHVATLLGAEDFLIRPLDSASVVAKAKQLLDGARRDRASR